jgi:coenzyme F420-0:L-glutamate ligase / coenzyme F420-1:gamma-L-glutamate ligase
MTGFTVTPVTGLGEIEPAADLVDIIGTAADLHDGDIVVVTSKIVSKAEGQLRSGVDREAAIDEETVRVVSEWTTPRGRTRIAETRHGFVMAAAGVDASNVTAGHVVLLPEDPDGSARRVRAGLRDRFGVDVGVVITDTAGRPWRDGVIDFAVGAAGVVVRDDFRGQTDSYGNDLGITVVAVADELASATELVRTKLSGVPVAVVRGLSRFTTTDDGPGVAALIRPSDEDRFRLGTPEAMREAVFARRDVASFTPEPVEPEAIARAVAAALSASAPHAATPWRFAVVREASRRTRVLDAMLEAWAADMRGDGVEESEIATRTAQSLPLRQAPYLVIACLVSNEARTYRDARRAAAEIGSFTLAMGAGIQNFMIALAAEGIGSRQVTAPLFYPDAVRTELDLPDGWEPMSAIAVGHAADAGPDHPDTDISRFMITL